jgi:hypothetical protein
MALCLHGGAGVERPAAGVPRLQPGSERVRDVAARGGVSVNGTGRVGCMVAAVVGGEPPNWRSRQKQLRISI